eukprot:Gb_10095 [translate_table: standard]
MTSFITRGIILILGYAYPAFECFKIVEKNKPEIDQLIFWCQYWIIIAAMTVLERVGDTFISWLPMYSEAKLAFIVYLWYPKTKGTTYVYETFVRPYVAKHETDIDRNLHELKTRAGDMALLYGKKSTVYVQTRFFELLQYVATQSSRARPVQNVQQPREPTPAAGSQEAVPAVGSGQALPLRINRQPISAGGSQPTKTKVSDPHETAQPAAAASGTLAPSSTADRGEDEMEVDSADVPTEKSVPREENIEQVIRMTRSRLKQTRTKS